MTDLKDHFTTVEISDSNHVADNLIWTTTNTPNLSHRTDVGFYANRRPEADTPIIILLHGVYGNAWAWAYSGGAHKTLADLSQNQEFPLFILAMPSDGAIGSGSGYFNSDAGQFENWIIDDVPAIARRVFPQLRKQPRLYLGGLSMGGYGALRLGMKHPDRISGISGHSSITKLDDFSKFLDLDNHHFKNTPITEHDLLTLFEKNKDRLPPIRFDCGVDDPLIESNRFLHNELEARHHSHIYEEFVGGHEWSYWCEQVAKTFEFFEQIERSK